MNRPILFSRSTLATALIAMFFIGCEMEEDTTAGIVGLWILTTATRTVTTADTTFVEKARLSNAVIYEFTETEYDAHFNYSCSDSWESKSDENQELSYELEGDNILILISSYYDAEFEETYTSADTFEYAIDGDNLTLIVREDYGDYESILQAEWDRYSGSIPPAEWLTGITSDNFEPDNSVSEATTLAIGSAAQVHTLHVNDADFYSITGQAGQTYVFESSGSMDTRMILYDAHGTTQLSEDDDSGESVNARIQWTCPTDGIYIIKVNANFPWDECGLYTIAAVISSVSKSLLPNPLPHQAGP